jgi:hypothetical protein
VFVPLPMCFLSTPLPSSWFFWGGFFMWRNEGEDGEIG